MWNDLSWRSDMTSSDCVIFRPCSIWLVSGDAILPYIVVKFLRCWAVESGNQQNGTPANLLITTDSDRDLEFSRPSDSARTCLRTLYRFQNNQIDNVVAPAQAESIEIPGSKCQMSNSGKLTLSCLTFQRTSFRNTKSHLIYWYILKIFTGLALG
jgi:hypothetical protein